MKNGIEDTKLISEVHDYVGAVEMPKNCIAGKISELPTFDMNSDGI